MNLSSAVRARGAHVDAFRGTEFIHKRISLSRPLLSTHSLFSLAYGRACDTAKLRYAKREIILKYARARNALGRGKAWAVIRDAG